jgi:hypothetical protein
LHRTSLRKLWRLGHDLKKLMTKASNRGLQIGPLARGEIELLKQAHKENWPRYPKQDARPVFTIEQFEPYVRELSDAVGKTIYGSAYTP